MDDVARTIYYSTAYIKVQTNPKRNANIRLQVVLGSSLGSLILAIGLLVYFIRKREGAGELPEEDQLDLVPGMPMRFSYNELKA
ncbi:hypothetical protein CDL15_Pgr002924 [Punica granatum]|uniref:Uncharacterized protein n=1 Tax=Punica granatum TaxID=22663 RepID=A0A218X1D3_PUNGR|nr:hypothetical protein CDL15_Pgr002924 [Punica granatum]